MPQIFGRFPSKQHRLKRRPLCNQYKVTQHAASKATTLIFHRFNNVHAQQCAAFVTGMQTCMMHVQDGPRISVPGNTLHDLKVEHNLMPMSTLHIHTVH